MALRIYPFDSAEVKEDKADRATLTFYLSGLNSKQKVEASVNGRTLTVRAVVDGKTYESRPEFAGDVQQGRLEPKVKDGRVHVSFTKVNNFSLSTIPQ